MIRMMGLDPNLQDEHFRNESLIHTAAFQDHPFIYTVFHDFSKGLDAKKDMINFLLQRGANINQVDKNNWTPLQNLLHNLTRTKHLERPLELMKFLVEHGADVNKYDHPVNSPLSFLLGH